MARKERAHGAHSHTRYTHHGFWHDRQHRRHRPQVERAGQPLQPRNLTHEIRAASGENAGFAQSGLPRFATQPRDSTLVGRRPPKVAQERLGHSTISVTLDLYSHVSATMQEDAAAKIDAAFRSAKTTSDVGAEGVR